jgi:hypothetical protein
MANVSNLKWKFEFKVNWGRVLEIRRLSISPQVSGIALKWKQEEELLLSSPRFNYALAIGRFSGRRISPRNAKQTKARLLGESSP